MRKEHGGVLSRGCARRERRERMGDCGGGDQDRVGKRCSLASEERDGDGGRGLADEGSHGGESHTEIRVERGGGAVRVERRGDGGIPGRAGAWRWRGGHCGCGQNAAEERRPGRLRRVDGLLLLLLLLPPLPVPTHAAPPITGRGHGPEQSVSQSSSEHGFWDKLRPCDGAHCVHEGKKERGFREKASSCGGAHSGLRRTSVDHVVCVIQSVEGVEPEDIGATGAANCDLEKNASSCQSGIKQKQGGSPKKHLTQKENDLNTWRSSHILNKL